MACSSRITIGGLELAAKEKGVKLMGTSDFLHSAWLSEIEANLEPINDSELFRIKGSDTGVRFMLTGEVSTVFTGNDGKAKAIHHIIMLPTLESVKDLRASLEKYGKLDSDGRTPLSMSAAELVEKVFETDKRAFLFPAHVWTPFFGALGARSGFDSLKDAYEDQEKHIHALETGLSSDPEMNWRISALDKYTLVSNSDMHSLPKLGREANMFEFDEKDLTYDSVVGAIRNKDARHLKKTIEFYPEEGKYHFDGHRDCGYSSDPSANRPTVCPVCGKKLVIGVLHRINDLADRPVGYTPKDAIPSVHIVPLREIIAYVLKKGEMTMAVEKQYQSLIAAFGTEFDILMDADLEGIAKASSEDMAEAIKNVRENKVNIMPGYAGVFGEVDLLNRHKGRINTLGIKQKSLFDMPKA